nr:TIGR04282 family arsenosugar biosynthesis glycosyltransferase [uncultured Cetobacterium sp.]
MNALVVMTRIPVPKKTKTRLMTILTPEECAEIHTAFLKDIIETGSQLKDTDFYLFYGDEGPLDLIKDLIKDDMTTLPQEGENLGEKMRNIFSELFNKGYEKIVLMGADIPEVSERDLQNAFDMLTTKDLVFGPTLDGGYYLVGMKKLYEVIFDPEIKWGTPEVFQETLEVIKKSGIEVNLIKTHEDIDTKEDLKALDNRIKNCDLCKNTKKYLNENIREKLLCQKN